MEIWKGFVERTKGFIAKGIKGSLGTLWNTENMTN